MQTLKDKWLWLVVGLGLIILAALTYRAEAADLGGDCCADLEERIAELEATAARKGNRKVTLAVYGQVNSGVLWVDIDDFSDTRVVQNGTDETFIGFAGAGRIDKNWTAGYVLEIDNHQLGLLGAGDGGVGLDVRQSYWWLKSEQLGKVAVGKQGVATQDFDKITTANTTAVSKPLSGGAFSDEYLTGIDAPFDGTYRNVVRYDSPVMSGFMASASWGNSVDGTVPDGDGDTWDAALRYAGEQGGFKLAGAVGYRKDTDLRFNILHAIKVTVPTGDVETMLAAGSVMHTATGIFLTANWADQDWKDAGFTLKGWQTTGGVEQQLNTLGKTTFYGEYGRISVDDEDVDLWGLGIVQALDGAAMDIYVGYREYGTADLIGDDLRTATAGARIKF